MVAEKQQSVAVSTADRHELLTATRYKSYRGGGHEMNIVLFSVIGLFAALALASLSCARSYYERGKLRGMREAVRELQVGMSRPLGTNLSQEVHQALKAYQHCLDRAQRQNTSGSILIHSQLWVLGSALAEECWSNGHGAGVRRKAPERGKIRVDLTVSELLQLGGLANVGFQHLMPNARIIDVRRFTGSDDAMEASRSISKIEAMIPKRFRPDLILQVESRKSLIEDWWSPLYKATA
jgi:hypothetical protein